MSSTEAENRWAAKPQRFSDKIREELVVGSVLRVVAFSLAFVFIVVVEAKFVAFFAFLVLLFGCVQIVDFLRPISSVKPSGPENGIRKSY